MYFCKKPHLKGKNRGTSTKQPPDILYQGTEMHESWAISFKILTKFSWWESLKFSPVFNPDTSQPSCIDIDLFTTIHNFTNRPSLKTVCQNLNIKNLMTICETTFGLYQIQMSDEISYIQIDLPAGHSWQWINSDFLGLGLKVPDGHFIGLVVGFAAVPTGQ